MEIHIANIPADILVQRVFRGTRQDLIAEGNGDELVLLNIVGFSKKVLTAKR
jgi:hypothetical protein